jgi:hypothetical protein
VVEYLNSVIIFEYKNSYASMSTCIIALLEANNMRISFSVFSTKRTKHYVNVYS